MFGVTADVVGTLEVADDPEKTVEVAGTRVGVTVTGVETADVAGVDAGVDADEATDDEEPDPEPQGAELSRAEL